MTTDFTLFQAGQEFGGPDMLARVVSLEKNHTLRLEVLAAPGFTWGMLPGRVYTLHQGARGYFTVEGQDPDFVLFLLEGEAEFRYLREFLE